MSTTHSPEPRKLQPLLHDLVSSVRAPAVVLSSTTGDIRPGGVEGWFVSDVRSISRLEVTVNGEPGDSVDGRSLGADSAHFTAVVRHLGDLIVDPTVVLERRREVHTDTWTETVRVTSTAQSPVDVELAVRVAADLASMSTVRAGEQSPSVPATVDGDQLRWSGELGTVTTRVEPAPNAVDAEQGLVRHTRTLSRGEVLEVRLEFAWSPASEPELTGVPAAPWNSVDTSGLEPDLRRLVEQGLLDLEALLLRDRAGDAFLAAGSPWYFTLFGRDSLWAARLMLPVSTSLALSTLRVLARRQGSMVDPGTEEEPGKILHELRSSELVLGEMSLPPLYYGTVDATPLWVILLAEAWRHGASPEEVRDLIPAAIGCLRWIRSAAEETGYLRYVDHTGAGLANQGWKDSFDSIQWADGRLAEAPIALSEVQGYAHEAVMGMADLLEAFPEHADGETPEACRLWAEDLRTRFRSDFWVADSEGRYPAVALDAGGSPVDSVASNMGHLLGTGILDAEEATLVARRLAGPDMSSGFGLRTLTDRSPRYSVLSYHCGTVWPHDTAITALGLAKEGHLDTAWDLVHGLAAAGPGFDYRLPELYGGTRRSAEHPSPIPYPTSCRPQAWAAAAPLVALHPSFQR